MATKAYIQNTVFFKIILVKALKRIIETFNHSRTQDDHVVLMLMPPLTMIYAI